MKILKLAAIPAFALAASAFSFAPAAFAAKAPAVCTRNCGATIKITGAYVTTAPGYYPTPAGPVITANATAKFSKTGTDVTDFRLLVDGKLVPKNYTAFGSGSVGVVYGTYTTGMSTDDYNSSISGTSFPVKVGKHALVYEILGVNGSVLATSASYSVTVPKQAAAVKPTLTYTATDHSYAPYFNVGNIDVYSATTGTLDATPNVLSFTVPAGVTLTDADGAQPNVTQSGTTVSITEARDVSLALPGSQWPPSFGFSYQSGNMSAPLTISSVTLDGIPVTPVS